MAADKGRGGNVADLSEVRKAACTLRLNLEYNRPLKDRQRAEEQAQRAGIALDWRTDVELSVDYLEFAVSNAHANGLEGQQRRIFGRIQRKLDAVVEEGGVEVALEHAEKDFLKKAFRDCKAPSAIAKYFVLLEEEVEKL